MGKTKRKINVRYSAEKHNGPATESSRRLPANDVNGFLLQGSRAGSKNTWREVDVSYESQANLVLPFSKQIPFISSVVHILTANVIGLRLSQLELLNETNIVLHYIIYRSTTFF